MEQLIWVIIYLVLTSICSLIAAKKKRSGLTCFGILMAVPIPMMILAAYGMGSNMESKGFVIWLAAFICPVIGFVTVLMLKNAEDAAVAMGEYGDYRKCPFCAESVRKEAIRCRHCHSELPH